MKNIAIICEYNPFHNGHAHQIKAMKEIYPDAGIICIMSGNYTQRAECAIYDKYTRARAAVHGGADLVLELPFPYSSAGAEYFATAGVHIADSLGCVDMLSFGSECGSTDKICGAAKNLLSPSFTSELACRITNEKSKSYAALREELYAELFGDASILREPNNILAIEYAKALSKINSTIEPVTVKRDGSGYNDDTATPGKYPSASALRALIEKGSIDALSEYMPHEVYEVYKDADAADAKLFERAVLSHLRLFDPSRWDDIAECAGGLGKRITDAADEAKSLDELFSLCATKKYTNARIRRAILFSLIGVREDDIKVPPSYTLLLAANERGRAILKKAKKNFSIIVKPAEYKNLTGTARAQIELSHKADAIYPLFFENRGTGHDFLTKSPYIKE